MNLCFAAPWLCCYRSRSNERSASQKPLSEFAVLCLCIYWWVLPHIQKFRCTGVWETLQLATKGGILDRCVGSHLGSFLEGKKRLKKEAVHSRLVTVNFNNQGNSHMRFVLGSYEISRSTHLSTQILKVYIEAWMGFSYIYTLDVVSTAPIVATLGRVYIPRTGVGARSIWLPESSSRLNWRSHPLNLHPPARCWDEYRWMQFTGSAREKKQQGQNQKGIKLHTMFSNSKKFLCGLMIQWLLENCERSWTRQWKLLYSQLRTLDFIY